MQEQEALSKREVRKYNKQKRAKSKGNQLLLTILLQFQWLKSISLSLTLASCSA